MRETIKVAFSPPILNAHIIQRKNESGPVTGNDHIYWSVSVKAKTNYKKSC